MKFWDASAIVPLLVVETQTRQLQSIAAKDSAIFTDQSRQSPVLFIILTTTRHRFETCDRTPPVNDQNRRTSLDTVDQGTDAGS